MTFSRTKKYVDERKYSMGGVILGSVIEKKDLGVIFDKKLTFRSHILASILKAKRMTGFIIRNCKHFSDTDTLKLMYYALVRPHLDYSSVTWEPTSRELVEKMEKVQLRFLRYLYYKDFGYYDKQISSVELREGYEMIRLEDFRNKNRIKFLHSLILGKINASDLLSKINLYVPHSQRNNDKVFKPHFSRTLVGYNSPINRMMRLYNTAQREVPELDIFGSGVSMLEGALKKIPWSRISST